jgi:hypothetical protein
VDDENLSARRPCGLVVKIGSRRIRREYAGFAIAGKARIDRETDYESD